MVSQEIHNICSEFINDPDTIIGMECNWHDLLIKEVPFQYNTDKENIIEEIPVINNKYGNMIIYITYRNQKLIITTKKWLLN